MAKKKSGENFFEEIMREMEFNAKYLIFFSNYKIILLEILKQKN